MFTLVNENDPILLGIAPQFDFSNPVIDHNELVTAMFEIMEQERGVGMAAPQLGISTRLFVMNVGTPTVCFNPEIVSSSSENEIHQEGCLSFPNLWLKVARAKSVHVKYTDAENCEQKRYLTDLEAVVFQHELDHLNGICFTKRVSSLVLKMAEKRRTKRN